MVGRVPDAEARRNAAAPGFTARTPCLGPGRVELHDDDCRRLRTLRVWLAWAAFALVSAFAVLSAL